MKILVINGPNINMLGIREPDIYGKNSFAELLKLLNQTAEKLNIDIEQYQSNHEGDIVDKIQWAYGKIDGIVINPAAYTHTRYYPCFLRNFRFGTNNRSRRTNVTFPMARVTSVMTVPISSNSFSSSAIPNRFIKSQYITNITTLK